MSGTLATPALASPTPPPAPPASSELADGATTAVVKGKPVPSDKLGKHDRDLLAEAQAARKPTVTAMLVTAKGEAADVSAQLSKLGGVVGYRNDKLGYVRATLPTAKAT